MAKLSTPWGQADQVDTIAPGILCVSTPGHGGIMLDAEHVARIPRTIPAGYSGSRAAWEEDADWSVPYLLFESEFSAWGCVKRMGAAEVNAIARKTLAGYLPDTLAIIDRHLAKTLALPSEPTPCGEQTLIPGCEARADKTGAAPSQASLFDAANQVQP